MSNQPASPAPSDVPPPYGPPLSLARAMLVAEAAEAEARAQGWPVVIAIFDSTGHLVLLHRNEQANLGAIELAQRKAATAVRFRRATKAFEEIIGGGAMRLLSAAPEIIALEGGIPLLQGGQVVGSIGVSGMASPQDAQVAVAGARALAGQA